MRATRRLTILLLLAPLLLARPAAADDQKAEALLKQGQQLLEKSDFEGALKVLKEAKALSMNAAIQLELAAAHEGLSQLVEAAEIYEALADEELFGEQETRRKERLAELRRSLGRLVVECRVDDASVQVNGRDVGTTPLPYPVYVKPGQATIVAQTPGKKVEKIVAVAAGEKKTVHFTMREKPKKVVPAKPLVALPPGVEEDKPQVTKTAEAPGEGRGFPPRLLGRRWTWVAAAGTVIAGAITMGLAISAYGDYQEYKDPETPSTKWAEMEDSLSAKATATNVMIGVTGTFAVATGVLFLVEGLLARKRAESGQRGWALRAGAGPGGGNVALDLSF